MGRQPHRYVGPRLLRTLKVNIRTFNQIRYSIGRAVGVAPAEHGPTQASLLASALLHYALSALSGSGPRVALLRVSCINSAWA